VLPNGHQLVVRQVGHRPRRRPDLPLPPPLPAVKPGHCVTPKYIPAVELPHMLTGGKIAPLRRTLTGLRIIPAARKFKPAKPETDLPARLRGERCSGLRIMQRQRRARSDCVVLLVTHRMAAAVSVNIGVRVKNVRVRQN